LNWKGGRDEVGKNVHGSPDRGGGMRSVGGPRTRGRAAGGRRPPSTTDAAGGRLTTISPIGCPIPGRFPFLIVKDRIIVADYNGKISAVDFNGKLIWQHDIAEDETASPPGFDARRARISGTAARPRTAASDDTAIFLSIMRSSSLVKTNAIKGRRLEKPIAGCTATNEGHAHEGSSLRRGLIRGN
jgi:hypothetical protein